MKSPDIITVQHRDRPRSVRSSKTLHIYQVFDSDRYYIDSCIVFNICSAFLDLCKFIALNLHKYRVA